MAARSPKSIFEHNLLRHITKKVFLVHHSDDIDVIKGYIIDPLEKGSYDGLKVECIYDGRHFTAGKTIITNIAECVKECHNTFVILTKTALERNWVKYETLLALEKSQREGWLCVTLVLFNVDPVVAQDAWFGLLTNAMMIHVDPNKKDWEGRLVQKMIQEIREPRPLKPVQIAANLSVGQVWSHYTGYAKIVLPELSRRIRSSELYQKNPGRFPVVEFNLIPQSARTVPSLSELHSSIQYVADLDVIKADRGSFKDRPYRVPVYSVDDPEEKQRYYFVAQIPNTLSILSKLENQPLSADGQSPALKISKGERSLQVARFYFAYNRLVNHPGYPPCNNMVKLVNYTDDHSVVKLLLKSVKEECAKQTSMEQFTEEMQDICIEGMSGPDKCSDFHRTVYIDFHSDCTTDVETGNNVRTFLSRNDIKVWDNTVPGRSQIQNFETALKDSKWCIFVISSEALHKEDSRLLMFKCRTVLHESVLQNEVRVIPILDGVREEDIPPDLGAVTYLSKQEPRYLDKLLKLIRCGSIKIEATVSARDVHQGLAWAYVLNYLEVTLENHIERLQEIQKKYPSGCVYKKLFIIVPSSCATKSLRALDEDKNGRQIDQRFKQLDEINFKTTAVGGVRNRDYQLIPYSIEADDKVYIVAVEYPNAVLCLKEMAELPILSGLDEEHLHDEAWKFKELAQSIIDSTDSVKNKAKLLYYDDSRLTVADAMLEVLKDESLNSYLQYLH